MLVSGGREPARRAPAVLAYAHGHESADTGELGGHLQKELKQEQIETATHPCERLEDLGAELLRVASWRAARTGLTGDLVHPGTGRPAPAATVVRALLEHVSPAREAAGDLDRVTARVEHLLAHGTGGDVQRRWRCGGADDADVMVRAAERTLA